MSLTKILLAGAVAGLVGILTSWLVTGIAFHPYQRRTPATWRTTEGPRQYALASGATVLAALMIALFFGLTGGVPALVGATWVVNGLVFGLLCWAALGVPVLGSIAVFVNLHRGVVVGLLLDWLLVSLLAGMAAAWTLHR